jgi:2-oxoisovalerate dehydrogenase E2 component (dihydrolipoyl transacylase)
MAERVFVMPDLGEGLEEGRIVRWLATEGATVELNQPLVEVETAKAVVEIPSPFAGVIHLLHGSEGEDLPVGSPLVTFDVPGVEPDIPRPPARSTPPVRHLAKELGVDLERLAGTGPDGRIVEQDVRAAAGEPAVRAGVVPGAPAHRGHLSAMRKQIAHNLEQVAAIPQVTTFRTVDCSALEPYRGELGVSPLPVVIAALARTIEGHPLLNATWMVTRDRGSSERGDELLVYDSVNVGLAIDTERGLSLAVVRDVQDRGIEAIATEARRLADDARAGRLSMNDVGGATIGVSNTGSYGSEAGTPLLTPGCAVTLAIGVIAVRALVVDGQVVARPAATMSLTFDHRVLDGAAAGRALTDLVDLLQSDDRLRHLPR